MTLSPAGRSALAYIERFGWHILPIKPGTKIPHARFVPHGHNDATCDPAQAFRWWKADPDAWIAVSAKASGIVIIDSDDYKPECELGELERRLGPLPHTPRVVTQRRGQHFYYRDECGSYNGIACPGVEIKSDGYCLLPSTPGYGWDSGAHVLETGLATLPDPWLRHVTAAPGRSPLPGSGTDATDSWLGHAFDAAGWLGAPLLDGKRIVRCPWLNEHSDGRGDGSDSSTVIFPRAKDRTLGVFRCSHSHCATRTWRDVVGVLPAKAKWAADQAMRRERNRIVLEQIAAMRRSA